MTKSPLTAISAGRARPPHTSRDSRPRGRYRMYTSYSGQRALLNTTAKRNGALAVLGLAVALTFMMTDETLVLLSVGLAMAVGAIGLNLVTGYAGQISLGHAFFVGLGAYTASVLGGNPESRDFGLGLDALIWLPAAGLVAGLVGALLAPVAVRLRGLYLAIVTLGLVFIGVHLFREMTVVTGGAGIGRRGPDLVVLGVDMGVDGTVLTGEQATYLCVLIVLLLMAIGARNLVRSRIGRAFAAVRDRDLAAEPMGINLFRVKMIAFAVSSAYAGVAGALLATVSGYIEPSGFGLLMSIQFLAMILLGGLATISGSIAGALFITFLPRLTQSVAEVLPFMDHRGNGSGLLSAFQLEQILYGLLIVVFVVAEPAGLMGIWNRIRTYWRSFPFTY
jgi:branched-chain amino acid transport system permease protein